MSDLLLKAALEYAKLSGDDLDLASPIGHGTDGSVWKTKGRKTAVKALGIQKNYTIELECYRRFKAHGVRKLGAFSVPELVGSDDRLLVIEMRIVTPPFVLDFAKAWLDRPMEFEEGGKEEWQSSCEEIFEENWPKVRSLLFSLQRYGIYYYDAKPANIMFKANGGE